MGFAHLDIIKALVNKYNLTIHKECLGEIHTELMIDKRKVDIHFFGGSHKNISHYKLLENFAISQGLCLPTIQTEHTPKRIFKTSQDAPIFFSKFEF